MRDESTLGPVGVIILGEWQSWQAPAITRLWPLSTETSISGVAAVSVVDAEEAVLEVHLMISTAMIRQAKKTPTVLRIEEIMTKVLND